MRSSSPASTSIMKASNSTTNQSTIEEAEVSPETYESITKDELAKAYYGMVLTYWDPIKEMRKTAKALRTTLNYFSTKKADKSKIERRLKKLATTGARTCGEAEEILAKK